MDMNTFRGLTTAFLILVFLGIVVWVVVGRALRPVDAMAREVATMGDRELDARVARPGTGDELDRPPKQVRSLVEQGKLGRKSGAGELSIAIAEAMREAHAKSASKMEEKVKSLYSDLGFDTS